MDSVRPSQRAAVQSEADKVHFLVLLSVPYCCICFATQPISATVAVLRHPALVLSAIFSENVHTSPNLLFVSLYLAICVQLSFQPAVSVPAKRVQRLLSATQLRIGGLELDPKPYNPRSIQCLYLRLLRQICGHAEQPGAYPASLPHGHGRQAAEGRRGEARHTGRHCGPPKGCCGCYCSGPGELLALVHVQAFVRFHQASLQAYFS